MPAILVEPLFANNPAHADWIRSKFGQQRLAQILADSIQRCFPSGGLIGFSVGHKYKTSAPNDRGATVYGGGSEADYAEQVLLMAEQFLQAMPARTARSLSIRSGNNELWHYEADPDANVRWDEARSILFIDEPSALADTAITRPIRRKRTVAPKTSKRAITAKRKSKPSPRTRIQ